MNRKWMAGFLAICLVLGSTSVALASSGRGTKGSQSPAAAGAQKGRSVDHQQKVSDLKAELAKLRELQRQANDLRHQLNHEYSGLRQAIGQAIDEGKVDLLKEKLPELQALRTKLQAASAEQEQERVQTQGFEAAKKSADVDGATARIQAAEARVQARIDALQSALDSMKTLSENITSQLTGAPSQPADEQDSDGATPPADTTTTTDQTTAPADSTVPATTTP